jgi:hypothetical protein
MRDVFERGVDGDVAFSIGISRGREIVGEGGITRRGGVGERAVAEMTRVITAAARVAGLLRAGAIVARSMLVRL